MKPVLSILLFAGVLLAQTKSTTTPAKAAPPKAKAAAADLLNPSTLKARAPEMFRARFTTTKGDFVVEVTRAWSPVGADRFYNLVRGGFFTDAAFFRVIPGFMVQFGISARPEVSHAWTHANILDDPVKQSNKRGRITFAKTGAPNSRTTQIFINFGDNSQLDAQGFSPFGEVVEGMDTVVDKLYGSYGESSDEQDKVESQGKAYLDRAWPKLDRILRAGIVPATPAAPAAAKPAAATKK